MIRTTITLAALLASPAIAANPDYPHREWGQVATLNMSLMDATTCIARQMNRTGDAAIIPAEGGNDIDWAAHVPWGHKMEPWMTFKVRRANDVTTLRILYRKPIGPGRVGKDVRKMQEHCLNVAKIEPVNE